MYYTWSNFGREVASCASAAPGVISSVMATDSKSSMILTSVRVGREHIGYLKWLLESHDGLATPTTRDGEPDVVDLMVPSDFARDLDDLLDALADEIPISRVSPPAEPPMGA